MLQSGNESVRPQFHYSYKSEAIILDSQYNYEGSLLAVCNSQGYIYLYAAQGEDSLKQPIFTYLAQTKKQVKNNAILKLSWSLPVFGLLASCNIYQTITLFKLTNSNKSLIQQKQTTLDCIPITLSFSPIQQECILSVGVSDGSIKLYNMDLEMIENVQGHFEVVNCLAWDSCLYLLEKNKWAMNNLINLNNLNINPQQNGNKSLIKTPFLLSCSSDSSIKLWKYMQGKLKLLGVIQKAHQKHIRMVDWKTSYFLQEQRTFVSCSQDFTVKVWNIKIFEDKCTFMIKGSTFMKGPVYKAKYNDIGNFLAVSYCNEQEEKVETKIYRQINGTLCNELKIQS